MRIEIDSVSFGYNKFKKVLDDVSVSLESGKIYVLTGQNGSGKTTLSKLICGLFAPQSGYISIDGLPVIKKYAGAISKKIGYLFQNPDMQFFAPTVEDELTFPFELSGELTDSVREKIKETLKALKLEEFKDRFPLTLSAGEKQRLALATVAVREAGFLILDEPTASADAEGKKFIAGYVNGFVAKGFGALVISHDEEAVELLENPVILRLEGGKICV